MQRGVVGQTPPVPLPSVLVVTAATGESGPVARAVTIAGDRLRPTHALTLAAKWGAAARTSMHVARLVKQAEAAGAGSPRLAPEQISGQAA